MDGTGAFSNHPWLDKAIIVDPIITHIVLLFSVRLSTFKIQPQPDSYPVFNHDTFKIFAPRQSRANKIETSGAPASSCCMLRNARYDVSQLIISTERARQSKCQKR
jgi:hypothetical protein